MVQPTAPQPLAIRSADREKNERKGKKKKKVLHFLSKESSQKQFSAYTFACV